MSHFSGHFEGASTFLPPKNLRGQKSLGPLKMSLEMAHKVIVPQKKIMSRSFLNSGTIIVILGSSIEINIFLPVNVRLGLLMLPACVLSPCFSLVNKVWDKSSRTGTSFPLAGGFCKLHANPNDRRKLPPQCHTL
jgi:hypothetical protein